MWKLNLHSFFLALVVYKKYLFAIVEKKAFSMQFIVVFGHKFCKPFAVAPHRADHRNFLFQKQCSQVDTCKKVIRSNVVSSLVVDAMGQCHYDILCKWSPISLLSLSLSRAPKHGKILYTYFESTSVNSQNFMPNLSGLFDM